MDRSITMAPDADPARFFIPASVEPNAPIAGSKIFYRQTAPPVDPYVTFVRATDLVVVGDEHLSEIGRLDRAAGRFDRVAVVKRCQIRDVAQQGSTVWFTSTGDGVSAVVAVDAATGNERWRQASSAEVIWMDAGGDDVDVALRTRTHVVSVVTFEKATGRVLHASNTSDQPEGDVLPSDQGLWLAGTTEAGRLRCFHIDPPNGATLARVDVPKDAEAPFPAISHGAIYVLRTSGTTEVYDASSGAPLMTDPLAPSAGPVDFTSSPAEVQVDGSTVRVSTTNGGTSMTTIRSYDPSTRRLRSSMTVAADQLAYGHAFHRSPPTFFELTDGLVYRRAFNGRGVEIQWLEAPPA